MAKVNLNNLSSLSNEASAISIINANNDAIEAAIEKTLSRDGTQPNQLDTDLDVNGHQLYNLSAPVTETSPLRVIDVIDPSVSIQIPATGTSGHVLGYLDTNNTHSGNNIFSGNNTNSGTNTYSGTDTFSGTVNLDGTVNLGSAELGPALLFSTGDIKHRYGTGNITGFVRCNGLSIGSSTSSATERANADCQNLFEYLWTADSNLTVSGGRGASASADWSANKTIALPDFRSRSLVGLASMGNTLSTLLDGITFNTGDSNTLGSTFGNALRTLIQAHLPSVNFTVSIPSGQGSHTHPFTDGNFTNDAASPNGISAGVSETSLRYSNSSTGRTTSAGTLPSMTGTAASGGSGTAFGTVPPSSLITIYIKL